MKEEKASIANITPVVDQSDGPKKLELEQPKTTELAVVAKNNSNNYGSNIENKVDLHNSSF